MGDSPPRELISLADDEGNSVSVNVRGRSRSWAAGLDAEIVVKTPFVSGRIDLALYVARLESWADALDRLDAGKDVAWMEMSRGPSIFIQLTGERDCPEVVVEDESGSMVTVRVPLVPPDDWIADHRRRLRQVMDHWVPMLSGQGDTAQDAESGARPSAAAVRTTLTVRHRQPTASAEPPRTPGSTVPERSNHPEEHCARSSKRAVREVMSASRGPK
ncbi:DUF5959 family protein [Streptomyces tendae]|uniref:DUF5959 family protein n=1 Tax=Streptomyces tendae TaxID=1932 RepID=UPI0033E25187